MRTMRYCSLLVLASALAWGESGVIPPQGWTPISGSQDNMSLYARVVDLDGEYIETPGSILAVFDSGGQCRSTALIEEGPVGKWYQMTVVSNAASETGLTLKILDSREGEIYDIEETFDFAKDITIPAENYTEEPWTLHVAGKDVSLQLEAGWNLVALTRPVTSESLGRLLAETPMKVESNAYMRCASVADFQVGVGYWFFSESDRRIELIPDMKQSSCNVPELVKGWNLVGASSDTPEWLPLAKYMFKWDGRGYEPTAKPALGVWVYRE